MDPIRRNQQTHQTNQVPAKQMGHGSSQTKAASSMAFEKSVIPNLQLNPKPHDWDIADEKGRNPGAEAMRQALL